MKTKPTTEQSALAAPLGSGATRDEEIWLQAKKEHEVTGQILDALRPLSQNERRRLLNYFWDRYVTNPN